MSLLYSVAFLALGAVVGRVFYIANRLPQVPRWAGPGATTCVALFITAMASVGSGLILEYVISWEERVTSVPGVMLMLVILAAGAILWVLVGRLAHRMHAGIVVDLPPAASGPGSPGNDGPRSAEPQTPAFPRRAA